MASARSMAASVVALGFAGPLAAPLPAVAAPGCARPERYAAQSGSELLRIDKLDLAPSGRIADSRTKIPSAGTGDQGRPDEESAGAASREPVGDVGLGNTRSVLIAGAPISSAGAARVLQGKVAGTTARNELAVQQAPPTQSKASGRQTGAKEYGPVSVGTGALHARAVWNAAMNCGAGEREVSSSAAEISQFTLTGGGSGAMVRVPEKISSRSATALRQRAGISQTVATATMNAGRINLVDNEVRIRVLRAPLLTVSAGGKSRVDYQPAVVEVTTGGGKKAQLDTAGEHVDITLSDEMRPLESAPAPLVPIGGLPVPSVPGLPVLSRTENTPIPDGNSGSLMRISLGSVRQATDGEAIAAAVTAIRVTVLRNDDNPDSKPSAVVADLGIGMLQAAAVAPARTAGAGAGRPGTGTDRPGPGADGPGAGVDRPGVGVDRPGMDGGRPGGGGDQLGDDLPGGGTERPGFGLGSGTGAGAGPGVGAGPGAGTDLGAGPDFVSGPDTAVDPATGLPLTGPRAISLVIAGAALILGGVGAVVVTSRRRRRQQS
ncbi:hypothetical protein [Actinoplanes couchii]|uniref:Gram-positive cocci surface proteins LPxTG domain-containing protein n=1 Tax=Actinoplanes couchii TaxID=403638 RepID=A0ABQ3XIK7_9ACTN|nr:hypothetical protein [Actinoplanes couchii]MDR6323853.1 hypothetical protein [Actinoplanes couchii]GID58323.1 hypothetical protein Aco03nite_067270 [Actinoplanes couchii]